MGLHERGLVEPTVSFTDLLYGSEGGPDIGCAGSQAQIGGPSSFSIAEYAQAIASSGFPGIAPLPPRLQRVQLDSYLLRIIDRDLPDRDVEVRRPETLRRWLAAYAAASSTTATYSSILDATTGGDGYQPSKDTTLRYRDHLQQLWLLDPIPGWTSFRNPLKRVSRAPKHQFADPVLALRLLDLSATDLLNGRGAHMFGPLLESLAALGVRILTQAAQARMFHLRTHGGDHNVDLVVEGQGGALLGIEVKLAAGIDDGDIRHLHWFKEQMRGDVSDLVILTTGSQAYRRTDGVAVVPLALLGVSPGPKRRLCRCLYHRPMGFADAEREAMRQRAEELRSSTTAPCGPRATQCFRLTTTPPSTSAHSSDGPPRLSTSGLALLDAGVACRADDVDAAHKRQAADSNHRRVAGQVIVRGGGRGVVAKLKAAQDADAVVDYTDVVWDDDVDAAHHRKRVNHRLVCGQCRVPEVEVVASHDRDGGVRRGDVPTSLLHGLAQDGKGEGGAAGLGGDGLGGPAAVFNGGEVRYQRRQFVGVGGGPQCLGAVIEFGEGELAVDVGVGKQFRNALALGVAGPLARSIRCGHEPRLTGTRAQAPRSG